MIAVIINPQQLQQPAPAGNMEMVEVMMPQMPQMPWGMRGLGSSDGFVDDNAYNNYNSWSNSPKDVWATEDWVHTPHSNGSQAGHGQMPWMPAEHQMARAPKTTKFQEMNPRQIQASLAEDPDAPPIGMRMQLQALQAEDPGSVLIARKLHRLGFNSAQKLQEHFSQYGGVREVLVPHSRVKASPGRRARTRPAAIGFVVMWSAEAAIAAIQEGNEHTIDGIQINVQAFERRSPDGSEEGGESPAWKSHSEESSDHEQRTSSKSEAEEVPTSMTSPKARWADISDEDDDPFVQCALPKAMDSPQSSHGGRWADLYGDDEASGYSTAASTPPQQDRTPKVCDYKEFYNNQGYDHNNQNYDYNYKEHYYQNNQHQRRQTGRGRANRGRA